jgi:hypothetical protein
VARRPKKDVPLVETPAEKPSLTPQVVVPPYQGLIDVPSFIEKGIEDGNTESIAHEEQDNNKQNPDPYKQTPTRPRDNSTLPSILNSID